MAIQNINIVAAATTTTYTSGSETALTFMSLCNYHAADIVTCDIHIVPSGGTADDTNLLIKAIDIAPTDTYILYHGNEKLVLGTGDFVSVVTSGAGIINMTVITSYMGV